MQLIKGRVWILQATDSMLFCLYLGEHGRGGRCYKKNLTSLWESGKTPKSKFTKLDQQRKFVRIAFIKYIRQW